MVARSPPGIRSLITLYEISLAKLSSLCEKRIPGWRAVNRSNIGSCLNESPSLGRLIVSRRRTMKSRHRATASRHRATAPRHRATASRGPAIASRCPTKACRLPEMPLRCRAVALGVAQSQLGVGQRALGVMQCHLSVAGRPLAADWRSQRAFHQLHCPDLVLIGNPLSASPYDARSRRHHNYVRDNHRVSRQEQ